MQEMREIEINFNAWIGHHPMRIVAFNVTRIDLRVLWFNDLCKQYLREHPEWDRVVWYGVSLRTGGICHSGYGFKQDGSMY